MAMIHFGGNSYPQCCQLVLEVDHTHDYAKHTYNIYMGIRPKALSSFLYISGCITSFIILFWSFIRCSASNIGQMFHLWVDHSPFLLSSAPETECNLADIFSDNLWQICADMMNLFDAFVMLNYKYFKLCFVNRSVSNRKYLTHSIRRYLRRNRFIEIDAKQACKIYSILSEGTCVGTVLLRLMQNKAVKYTDNNMKSS